MMRKLLAVLYALIAVGGLAGCFLLNADPVASFSTSPLSGESPLLVRFDATGSADPNGQIVEYQWDFGDGSPVETMTSPETSHVFAPTTDKSYTVTLVVVDEGGATGVRQQTIYVSAVPDPDNNAPTARFTFDPGYGDSPLVVDFDAGLSSDVDGEIEIYSWDFGDTTTGSGETISHTFSALATTNFTVILTVYDEDGGASSTTGVITVYVSEVIATDRPTAEFSIEEIEVVYESPDVPAIPSLFDVTLDPAGSAAAPGHEIEFWVWTFGDGESATLDFEAPITHTYSSSLPSRSYVATLMVIDEQGLTDSISRNVTVTQP